MTTLSTSITKAQTDEICVDSNLLQDHLEDDLSFDPVEQDCDSQHEYCDVVTAAQLLGKSQRQVQRLLKDGKLQGHKAPGRTGPEWKIDRKALVIQHSSQTDQEILFAQLSVMESKIELVANAMMGLKLRIEGFDADFERLKSTESAAEVTAQDLRQLKDQLDQAKLQIEETASVVRDRQPPSPTLKIAKAQSEGELAEVVQVNEPRQSWWQRVLA